MTKLFAIVSPPFTKAGDSFTDLCSLIVNPFHSTFYEQVCGYSLGHEVNFFATIEEAKSSLEIGLKGAKSDSKATAQKAILELDTDEQGLITGFCKIHTADVQKVYEQAETGRFFKATRLPDWKEQPIKANDITEGALDELNVQYKASKVQDNEKEKEGVADHAPK